MPFITVGAENSAPIDLYYEDHGSGQPVVLIHGFPLSNRAWEKQVPELLHAGYRTIAYDRRGFGNSSQPATGYDYDTFAADLDAILRELDLRDTILIGHSMGTGEITRYLGNYGSARVSKVVLISPIPPFLMQTDDNPQGVPKQVFEGFQDAIRKDRFAYQTSFMNDFFNYDQNKGKSVSEEAYQANWDLAVIASPIGTEKCVDAWLTDFRGDLPRIDVPALLIQGDQDRVLPYPVTGERLQPLLPQSTLHTIAGGPHAIPWTHSDEVNRAILDFVGQGAPVYSRAW